MTIRKAPLLLVCVLLAFPAFAADGGATFDSFYRSPWEINYGLAAIVALVIGALVLVGLPVLGPILTPTIASIGTSIGGLFGLSGAAATNFGLAMLGGGSVASGGFGIAGGTAVLAAALTFSTDVVFDYSLGKLSGAYDARQFETVSRKMMTLPLPRDTSGPPDSVEAAGEMLTPGIAKMAWECAKASQARINAFKACLDAGQPEQASRVKAAIKEMGRFTPTPSMSPESAERRSAMLALLHFLNNDYGRAVESSREAYGLGLQAKHAPTLSSFILAVSLLYDEVPNYEDSFKRFEYAIVTEPDNALTPLLFTAYLDRLSYRLNDGSATAVDLRRVDVLAQSLPDDQRKLVAQQTLLAHYLRQAKLAQQRVLSLTGAQTPGISEDPRTIGVVRSALAGHEQMVSLGQSTATRQQALLAQFARDESWWERVKSMKNPFGQEADKKLLAEIDGSLHGFENVLADYRSGNAALVAHVTDYEDHLKESLVKQEAVPAASEEGGRAPFFKWLKSLFQ